MGGKATRGQHTRLVSSLCARRPHLRLLDSARLDILQRGAHSPQRTHAFWHWHVGRRDRLQPLPLAPTQLHNLVLEPLLALVPLPLSCPTTRLVTARNPTRNPRFRRVAPYVPIDGRDERIVRAFQRRRA